MAIAESTVRAKTERPTRRITLDEYHWLIAHGFFRPDDRLELIGGQLVEMSPIYPPHASTVTRLAKIFDRCVGEQIAVRSQQPITIKNQDSEPEPDVALAAPKGNPNEFDLRHPDPEEVLLLCEVSDATLAYDRNVKLPMYAKALIREYWIVDVAHRKLEVYRDPGHSGKKPAYRQKFEVLPGQRIAPLMLPDCETDPALFLPQPRGE